MRIKLLAGLLAAAFLPWAYAQEGDTPAGGDGQVTSGESALEDGTEEDEDTGPTYQQERMATLRALDKITGRSTDFEIEVDEPVIYGSLEVDLKACFQTPPEEPPESAAFLQISTTTATEMAAMAEPRLASEVKANNGSEGNSSEPNGSEEEDETLFSGWMFASSPGLSALEHPVYDVWVIRCKQPSPDSLSSPASPDE